LGQGPKKIEQDHGPALITLRYTHASNFSSYRDGRGLSADLSSQDLDRKAGALSAVAAHPGCGA